MAIVDQVVEGVDQLEVLPKPLVVCMERTNLDPSLFSLRVEKSSFGEATGLVK